MFSASLVQEARGEPCVPAEGTAGVASDSTSLKQKQVFRACTAGPEAGPATCSCTDSTAKAASTSPAYVPSPILAAACRVGGRAPRVMVMFVS